MVEFLLCDGARDIEVLTDDLLKGLLEQGKIIVPSISEKHIQALGKGDGLSKIIVVGQTSWFIAECISRALQELVFMGPEVLTLAFATLNGFMYLLWWNKPLDASYHILVRILNDPTSVTILHQSSEYTQSSIDSIRPSVEEHERDFNEPAPNAEPLYPTVADIQSDFAKFGGICDRELGYIFLESFCLEQLCTHRASK